MDWQLFAAQASFCFVVALVTEGLATACSVTISRNNFWGAILFHNLWVVTANIGIMFVVQDLVMIVPIGFGEAVGGTLTLYLTMSKSSPIHNWAKRGRVRLIAIGNSIFKRGRVQKRKQKPRGKYGKPLTDVKKVPTERQGE